MAFEKIEAAFLEPESMSGPDRELPLILQTNALSEDPNPQEKIIPYFAKCHLYLCI